MENTLHRLADIGEPSRRARRISEHVTAAIERAPAPDTPFSHFYLEGMLPDDVYAQIAAMLPSEEIYHHYFHKEAIRFDGTSTRRVFPLDARRLRQLDQPRRLFWMDVADALLGQAVKTAMFRKLATDLGDRFDVSRERVASIASYPHLALLRDEAGYKISIHQDVSWKIVTFQAYLPSDNTQRPLGTSIYEERSMAERTAGAKRFRLVKTFEFLPNTAYGFAVSRKSWHGRDEIPADSRPRHSLTLIHYAEPGHGY